MRATLALIARAEAGGGYDVVWQGIATEDRPEARTGKRLTRMTVQEVVDWQRSIDARHDSEAAGAYQCMEDTLRDLIARGRLDPESAYDRAGQDRIALLLMEERGLSSAASGVLPLARFANNLACCWAALPCVEDFVLAGRAVRRGEGVWDGPANRCSVAPEEMMSALREDLRVPEAAATASADAAAPPEADAGRIRGDPGAPTAVHAAAQAVRDGIRRLDELDGPLRDAVLRLVHRDQAAKGSRTLRDGARGQAAAGGIAGAGICGWLAQYVPQLEPYVELVQDHAPLVLGAAGLAALVIVSRMIRWRVEDSASGRHRR